MFSIIFFILISNNTIAKDDYPSSIWVHSVKDRSTMKVICDSQATNVIKCSFNQLSLTNGNHKDLNEVKKEIRATSDKEIQSSLSKMCKGYKNSSTDKELKDLAESPFRKQHLLDSLKLFEKSCGKQKSSRENFLELIEGLYKIEDLTCEIHTNSFHSIFNKIGDGKWASTGKPAGLCNYLNISTLNRVDYGNFSHWIYTQSTVAGDTDKELCDRKLNVPYEFRSNLNWSIKSDCMYIKLIPGY